MSGISHLRALQALEMAIRKGTLRSAAVELSITPAAVGQRIKSLEDYLGFDLIVRGRSGIRASRELISAIPHLNAAFRELEIVSGLLDFQRVNEIHITADSDWATLWLEPRLQSFQEQNPNTLFCVNGVGDTPVRLGDADCEINFSNEQLSNADDLLFYDYMVPVATQKNKKRVTGRSTIEALEGYPLLHLDSYTVSADDIGWTEWIQHFGHRRTAPERGIRYQKLVHALEAVYADAGQIVCGIALIQQQLSAGKVALLFPIDEGLWSKNAYCAHFRADSLQRGAVKNFRDWLLRESQQTTDEIMAMTGKAK